jgi:uncharacterized membrane protein
VLNPRLAGFTAILYVLLGWAVVGPIDEFGRQALPEAASAIASELVHRVGMTVVLVGLVLAVMLFTDTHSRLQRTLGGGLHGLAHQAGSTPPSCSPTTRAGPRPR